MARKLVKAAGKASLDKPMAALSAASAGFVVFAMPDAIFADMVVASGLPNLLAAAEPPLGRTARLASVAAVAVGVFLLVWQVLRALGQKPAAVAAAPAPVEAEAEPSLRRRSFAAIAEPYSEPPAEAPRIRRADAHPDAPSRRPLFAGSDLGEPLDEIDVSQDGAGEWHDSFDDGEEQWAEPLPGFIAEQPAPLDPAAFDDYAPARAEALESQADAEAAIEVETEAETEFEPEAEAEFEPEAEAEIHAEADIDPEAEADEDVVDNPAYASLVSGPSIDEPAAQSEEWVDDYASHPQEPEVAETPEPEIVFDPQPKQLGDASISELMQRLERGLLRLDQPMADSSSAPETAQADTRAPVDDRLRNALDDLQKMASRSAQG